ncbi:hypothetical protein E3N88_39412 [Mikania micrantha]|uniref:Protein kinase domain-containing protein n=1 Tax=Mikania micrantha TaxID=192012 RepID=A0A5N6LXK5_9ASTR|nr:hypothetical protein E3N88_39412 [Mikania micrantha]
MKKLNWFKQISNNGKLERRLSLGEYRRAVSWSKYLVSSGGILHRDLKSENLLLGEDMCLKVADFGISCLESQCGSAKGFTGTYRWMAPEMIREKKHTKKIDVYSFAIVLWELLTALTPFDDMTPEQAAFAVCQKNARPPLPDSCPTVFRQLISRCWSSKPEKRPGFDEIVRILEKYTDCVEENPDFLTTYEPDNDSSFGCDRGCFGPRKTASRN